MMAVGTLMSAGPV